MKKINVNTIIISRTDAIGDVVLTLPMAGVLKKHFPNCRIIFFGRTYTEQIISLSKHIDAFINFDLFEKTENKTQFLKNINADTIIHVFPKKSIARAAKKAGIQNRIGTSHRLYHFFTCNFKVALGRKKSNLHEAQLNLKLLQPFGITESFTLDEIPLYYGIHKIKPLPQKLKNLIDTNKFNLILHPKSNASAREWNLKHFNTLITFLPATKFNIFITGSEKEKNTLGDFIASLQNRIIDLTGKMTLDELISFIDACDGLIAASTGPLHISAALGKNTLGIYPPIKPQDPVRWAPIGNKAEFMVAKKNCVDCKNATSSCACMNLITPEMVFRSVTKWNK